jgi:hypothetical protein
VSREAIGVVVMRRREVEKMGREVNMDRHEIRIRGMGRLRGLVCVISFQHIRAVM